MDLKGLLGRRRVRGILAGIADHSPYLWQLVESDPSRLHRILTTDPMSRLDAILAELRNGMDPTEADLMRRLRLAKQEVALLVAIADLGGAWCLDDVVVALSLAAETYLGVALDHLLRAAHSAGKIKLADLMSPSDGCGIGILGLGKLGGNELNYSSDVDLVVIFDPDSDAIVERDDCKTLFVRMVQNLVRLLQQATVDGYVLRVDLRLRPDPGATAVAIGLEAALLYYESFGQSWERAAMIKARPVAGDMALGRRFIGLLEPFIWRKYLDYTAIAEIHAMKRRIHAAKGHAEIAVAGHDVKLGRGGIREIEFFVQTQQLIFGGKLPDLRGVETLSMLQQLRRDGWLSTRAVSDLKRAYRFLRRIEHRLQMIADQQTHRLPRSVLDLERFARFCGFAAATRLSDVLLRHLRAVAHHDALLFESALGLETFRARLLPGGAMDMSDTTDALAALGYASPDVVARTIREWYSGRSFGGRSARFLENLRELLPKLLITFADTSDPDAAVAAFDKALQRMPAAGELFAILSANAALRALFGDILGGAPRLAAEVIVRPHLLDEVIVPSGDIRLDDPQVEQHAEARVADLRPIENFLDAIRDFHHEEHFRIGVAVLSGAINPDDAGRAYAALASGILRVVLRRCRQAFAAEHGHVPGAEMAVVAMGKLGSWEMTATSDLDLVIVYTFDRNRSVSDGPRPLEASRYFTRLTQRLVSYLTAATRRGKLYDVDMRLRPSGRQGPLATQRTAFLRYQRQEAATWEHMALTRARVVAGDAAISRRLATDIRAILRRHPNARLAHDVVEMRALIEAEKPALGRWDLKRARGALIDIEFIAQYIVLRNAAAVPKILDQSTSGILRRARALGLLGERESHCLIGAHRLFTNATQIIRLALEDGRDPDNSGVGVMRRIVAATDMRDGPALVAALEQARQAVREIFRTLLATG